MENHKKREYCLIFNKNVNYQLKYIAFYQQDIITAPVVIELKFVLSSIFVGKSQVSVGMKAIARNQFVWRVDENGVAGEVAPSLWRLRSQPFRLRWIGDVSLSSTRFLLRVSKTLSLCPWIPTGYCLLFSHLGTAGESRKKVFITQLRLYLCCYL